MAVFTEGAVTEPTYITAWARTVRNHTIVNLEARTGRDPRTLVEMAVDLKAKEERDAGRGRGREHDEYWCVFDIDEHAKIGEAVQLADARGIRLAISDPCFELWLLLHERDQTAHLSRDDARRAVRDEMGIEKSISPQQLERLLDRYEEAAKRARTLDKRHADSGSDGNPSSGMPNLIEGLRRGAQ